jgi:hypothetical protein
MKGLRPGLSLVGTSGPLPTGGNATVVPVGGGEYLVTKTNADAWDAGAYFAPITGDFRCRFQPLQSNHALALQLDTDTAFAAPVFGDIAGEQIYYRADTTFGCMTNTVEHNADVYAANDYFWLERIGTVAKTYRGGTGTFASSTLFQTYPGDASDTTRLKLSMSNQNSQAKLRLYLL